VTGITSKLLPNTLVSFAGADPRMLITSDSPKAGHSVERSVMSLPSPLCRGHHREVHHCGDEAAWWRNAGVDPTGSARALWLDTHPLASDKMLEVASIAPVGTDKRSAKRDRPVDKGDPNYSRVEG